MKSKVILGIILTPLFVGMLTFAFSIQPVRAVPEIILSDKEIIPNPENSSSIAFTATPQSPTTMKFFFQIKEDFNHPECLSQPSPYFALQNSTRLTMVFVNPYDPRFNILPTIEGTTIYMVDPYYFYNYPSNWVYAITTERFSWEYALTGYLSELKPGKMGPAIQILSPLEGEYTTTDIPLIFTVDEPTDWIGYSLDGQANLTIAGNTTLTDLSIGWHRIWVYANDTSGNMGASNVRWFAVSELAVGVVINSHPNVTITQKYVTSDAIYFNVSGPTGLIGYINITFPIINTTKIRVFIDYEELASPFPIITTNGTHYFIYFEFTLSTHTITTQFAPSLIPEFPSSLVLPLFMIATLLAVIVYRRKHTTYH